MLIDKANPLISHHSCWPARQQGLVVTDSQMIIPETVRKKFITGWHKHIPLTYLTDQNCARTTIDLEANHDLLTVSLSAGLITTTSKPLSTEGEANLSFCEWCKAWKRLFHLIQDYSPAKYDIWSQHHSQIRDAEDCTTKWSLSPIYMTIIHPC
ncbi:hypothetical protein M422DRAFT_269661 [Sphaerobolus stellatus SS14]|uniref:Uncharacterized protein n=1 Tax=Sphaerobolus stellatus (strain SS14) TaxID=990650 RepID=A0A0C9THL2_SPHS4|nr:hypothetical protein M422DRAFT_269661 [Sphaerobolus stellatus SS14]